MNRDHTGQGRSGTHQYLKPRTQRKKTNQLLAAASTLIKSTPPAKVRTCAVPLLRCESEAAVAATLETANCVSAGSMGAQTLEHLTLIHI